MHDFLFTFLNTHQALKGEKVLKSCGLEVKLIPTPYEIFAECGFSLKLKADEKKLEELTGRGDWEYAGCYLMLPNREGKFLYERI